MVENEYSELKYQEKRTHLFIGRVRFLLDYHTNDWGFIFLHIMLAKKILIGTIFKIKIFLTIFLFEAKSITKGNLFRSTRAVQTRE